MGPKGKGAPRAARPSTNHLEPAPPGESPRESAKPMDRAAEGPISTKPPAEVMMPTATSVVPPGVEAPAGTAKTASSGDPSDFGLDAFAALVESQTAVARGLGALNTELAGLTLSGIDAAARTATGLLAVKTVSDAIALSTGFTRSSVDALVGGSAKLSELGAKLVAEAAQPILTQLGRGWSKAARLAF